MTEIVFKDGDRLVVTNSWTVSSGNETTGPLRITYFDQLHGAQVCIVAYSQVTFGEFLEKLHIAHKSPQTPVDLR